MDDEEIPKSNSDTLSHEIPDDIIVDILSRTTSKDLSRGNCVSKRWRDSFTLQAFKQRHFYSLDTELNPHYTVLFYNNEPPFSNSYFGMLLFETPRKKRKNKNRKTLRTRRIKWIFRTSPAHLSKYSVCSNICHGLACLYNMWLDSLSDSSIVLYSTRTNDAVVLPTTTNMDDLSTLNKTLLVFCYIGFDTLRKEYKVIRSTCATTTDKQQMVGRISYETLTLGSRSWNQIDNAKVPLSLSQGWASGYGPGLYLDGSIFWIHFDHTEVGSLKPYKYSYTVAAFDLKDEEFRVFELDSILQEWSSGQPAGCYVAEFRNCPTAFAFKNGDNSYDDVLVCAFTDCKMTSVGWSQSIRTRGSWNGPSVSESRVIRFREFGRVFHSGMWRKFTLYLSCIDHENDISLEIVIKI